MSVSDTKGVVGLTNIGNTCYGNAVLQALRHQVDLTIFILQGNHEALLKKKPASEKKKLLEEYATLVRNLWSGERGAVSTRDLWTAMIPAAMKAGFEQFRIPMAHDAHEFLVFLLDQFHEALAEQVNMTIRTSSSNPDVKGALAFWKQSFEKSYSPFVELLFGIQRKSVKCPCGYESITWESLNIFKTSVPAATGGSVKLLDLMAAEGAPDTIDGYACDSCKGKTKATVSRSLWRLGNWVIVVLKRNENSGRRINTVVEIPDTTSFASIFHTASTEPSGRDMYELFATVNHHGSSGGGHYTSQAKHPVSGRWALYDDEGTQPIGSPELGPSTYIVMYRRQPASAKPLAALAPAATPAAPVAA